jgi:hypothetical protein
LTLFHLSCLRSSNPSAIIVPLTDDVPELLPDSIDVSKLPPFCDDSPKWRSIDNTLYRWFANRNVEADFYVTIEYDCLCTVELTKHFQCADTDEVIGVDLFQRSANPDWQWFREAEVAKLPIGDRRFAAGVVPFTCMMFSHKALLGIVTNMWRNDIFCELRLGTIIRKLNLKFRRLPLYARSTICWHTYSWQANRPGLFHSIKSLEHNQNRSTQPGYLVSWINDLFRSMNRDREFLPFNLHGKWQKVMRLLGLSQQS